MQLLTPKSETKWFLILGEWGNSNAILGHWLLPDDA